MFQLLLYERLYCTTDLFLRLASSNLPNPFSVLCHDKNGASRKDNALEGSCTRNTSIDQ